MKGCFKHPFFCSLVIWHFFLSVSGNGKEKKQKKPVSRLEIEKGCICLCRYISFPSDTNSGHSVTIKQTSGGRSGLPAFLPCKV